MMHLLVISLSAFGVKAGQFILSFSILVILHELGHFLPAKWFGCRVDKFYLFFNPWFSLAKKKIGETEYGLGWIPFGGYVKIAGMVDESMDREQLKAPPQPYEFRSKPAWQRLIIMLGGVTVNVLLALTIFIFITWTWGDEYLPPKNVTYGLAVDSLGRSVGLKDGDIITKVGATPVKDETKATLQILTSEANNITVLRDGQSQQISIPDDLVKSLSKSKGSGFVSIRFPAIVDTFPENSNAQKAGIKKGDRIIGMDSLKTPFFQDFQQAVRQRKNESVNVLVLRGTDSLTIPVNVNNEGMIGIAPVNDLHQLNLTTERKTYTFLESFPAGWHRCW